MSWSMSMPGSPQMAAGIPVPTSPLHMPQAMLQISPQQRHSVGDIPPFGKFSAPPPLPQEAMSKGDVTRVVLMGLPAHLCNYAAIEVMLDQAGLEDAVMNFNVTAPPENPQVIVTLLNKQAATQCIAHFHGRQWGNNGALVIASLMKQPDGRMSPGEQPGAFQRTNTDTSAFTDKESTSAGTAEEESCTDENGYVTDDGF